MDEGSSFPIHTSATEIITTESFSSSGVILDRTEVSVCFRQVWFPLSTVVIPSAKDTADRSTHMGAVMLYHRTMLAHACELVLRLPFKKERFEPYYQNTVCALSFIFCCLQWTVNKCSRIQTVLLLQNLVVEKTFLLLIQLTQYTSSHNLWFSRLLPEETAESPVGKTL